MNLSSKTRSSPVYFLKTSPKPSFQDICTNPRAITYNSHHGERLFSVTTSSDQIKVVISLIGWWNNVPIQASSPNICLSPHPVIGDVIRDIRKKAELLFPGTRNRHVLNPKASTCNMSTTRTVTAQRTLPVQCVAVCVSVGIHL